MHFNEIPGGSRFQHRCTPIEPLIFDYPLPGQPSRLIDPAESWELSRVKGRGSNRAGVTKESGWDSVVVRLARRKGRRRAKTLLAFVAGLIRTGVLHILIIARLMVAPRPTSINIQRIA